jgi:hypothetical protein
MAEVATDIVISALSGREKQHQWSAFTVDKGVDSGAHSTTGTVTPMIVRLIKQIHVRRGPSGARKVGAVLVGAVHRWINDDRPVHFTAGLRLGQ